MPSMRSPTAPAPSASSPAPASATVRPAEHGRRLRRLRALAVLRLEVPLLRLQQPRARGRHRRGALPARLSARACATGPSWRRGAASAASSSAAARHRSCRAATVGAILDAIARLWSVDADAEITLEANPSSVEAARFRGYRAAGINRVSLGVQSLDDADLRALGRLHTRRRRRWPRSMLSRETFDALLLRPDLRPARPDAAGLARGAGAGPGAGRPASVALPAHHRAGDAVRRSSMPAASCACRTASWRTTSTS